MKVVRLLGALCVVLGTLSCQSGGTTFEPIVIDLTAARTPSPTSGAATPSPTQAPQPTVTPAAAAPVPSPAPVAASSPSLSRSLDPAREVPRTLEEIAVRRMDAFNRRDLEGLAALYASDAQIFDPPDRLRDSGRDQIRQTYARRFSSSSNARLSADGRMTEGNFVVERETESGAAGAPQSAIVISEVRDGKIVRVWVLH
jgi:hypothetical protein